jgi:predicted MPP superfamily phosphohydrolase
MNRSLDQCLQEISAISHYQGTDYDGIRNRIGEDLLRKRLNRQLNLYLSHRTANGEGGLRWQRRVMRDLIRVGLTSTGLMNRAKRNARNPVMTEHEVVLEGLPDAFEGYRILHLSDFHFEFIPELPGVLNRMLEGLDFDVCVLTGDFRGETTGPYEESLEHLATCRGHMGAEVMAVLGNHDNIELLPRLSDLGIRCLMNESSWIEKEGDRILVAGIDDPHYYQTHDLERFRPQVRQAAVSILLSHSPECCREAADIGFDVMLAGHTHGGQLCLPGGIPLLSHIGNAPRACIRGEWHVDGLHGYTSSGVGCSSLDVRLNCPPELVIHTLRQQQD